MQGLGKVLLVDDDAIHNFLSARTLSQANAVEQVFEVENGQLALDLVTKETLDLILLDVNMPIMNGCEFLEALKKLVEVTCFTPPVIVLMTTTECYFDSDSVTQDPMVKGLLTKPLTHDHINFLLSLIQVEKSAPTPDSLLY
ncbi:response regulator [Pontibacter brevis]